MHGDFGYVLGALTSAPWMLEQRAGELLARALSTRIRDGRGDAAGIAAARAAKNDRSKQAAGRPRGGQVSVIPVHGTLVQRASLFTEVSGLMSMEEIGLMFDGEIANPDVESIVLDVDSPGGSVFGTAELGSKIAAGAKRKRVVAVANSTAASGAYWLASQASELVVTPGGMVGSIGVFLMHADRSKEMLEAGQVITYVFAGERKVAANEFAPLDDAGRQQLQEIVDGYHADFSTAVARGRGVSVATVKESFGQGGMVLAKPAVAKGMADRVATLEQVVDGLLSTTQPSAGRGGSGNGGRASATLPKLSKDPEIQKRIDSLAASRNRDEIDRRRHQMEVSSLETAALIAKAKKAAAVPVKPVTTSTAAERGPTADFRIAAHEAGHVLCAVLLNVPIYKATIEPCVSDNGNRCEGLVTHAATNPMDSAVIAYAGTVAEKAFGYAWDLSGDDFETVRAAGSPLGALDRAANLISQNRSTVEKVANSLIQHRILSGESLAALCRG